MVYKLSNYNFFISYNDRVILHNLLTGSLYSLEKELFEEVEPLLNQLELLKSKSTPIFNLLFKTGFIIEFDYDEIDYLRLNYIKEMSLNSFYRLTINPTLECNFSCWYCYQNHPAGYMNEEVVDKIIKMCNNLVKSKQVSGINLGWFGGEPLLYFNEIIYPLSKHIKQITSENSLNFYNSITTNGYLITDNLIDKFYEIDLFEFQITLDGNEERHNKIRNNKGKPSYAKIVNNINRLVSKVENAKVCLRINYDDKTFNGLESIFNSFAEIRQNIHIDLQRVWQTYENEGMPIGKAAVDFSTKCIDFGFKLMNTYLEAGRGTPCYADRINFAHINYDGRIYKCTARNYEDSNELGYIDENGLIKWHTKKLMPSHRKLSFENEICLTCKFLPICLGPCYQKRYENRCISSYCFRDGYDEFINDYIILKYKQKFKNN